MSPNMLEVDERVLDVQIFKEYNKTKEDLNDYINIMRNWAKTQLHFPEVPGDKLIRFIVLINKFSIEKAKQKLDMYYTIRSLMPEFYSNSPLSSEMVLHNRTVYVVLLPKMTSDFKRLIYAQVNPQFGSEFFFEEKVIACCLNIIELMILEDKCFNSYFIMDCKGVQFGHISKVNPLTLKKATVILEKVYSNRLAGIYLVNVPKYAETFLNAVVKPVFNQKLRDRFKIDSGTDILFKDFGGFVLPKDIGGEEKSLDELTDSFVQCFESRKDRFEFLRTLRVDESLRPKKLVNDDILGYYGNFRKIDVD